MAFAIGVVRRKQVQVARDASFVAFGHGKHARVESLSVCDRVIYHAPRVEPEGDPVQAFVADAAVTGEGVRQRVFGDGRTGWVRDAGLGPVREVPARRLLDRLSFLAGRGRNCGMPLCGGRFGIPEDDYRPIAPEMAVADV